MLILKDTNIKYVDIKGHQQKIKKAIAWKWNGDKHWLAQVFLNGIKSYSSQTLYYSTKMLGETKNIFEVFWGDLLVKTENLRFS